MAADFDELYQFIPGEDRDDRYLPTSRDQLAKARGFKEAMMEARDVIVSELATVERSVTIPAKDARKHMDIYRKRIKQREDRKVRRASCFGTQLTQADAVGLGEIQEPYRCHGKEDQQVRERRARVDEASD